MHNKRIGRDDLLKIEVRNASKPYRALAHLVHSGPVLLLLPLGVSTLVVIVAVIAVLDVNVPLLVAGGVPHLLAAAVTTLLARMIAVTAITTGVTALVAQMTVT